MKKILLISIALFTTLSMNAQVEKLIYEMDWAGVEYIEWNYFVGEAPNASYYKATDEGLAITNPAINDHIWEVRVINRSSEDHGLSLEEGHDYVVRLTLKVPSDGHIFMQLGNLASSWYDGASVTASDDWQVIDIESTSYYDISGGAHVLLGFGEMVGTTILKKVQVYERTTPKYFPTGMTWEEVVVTPDMGREYYNAHIYEISTDTIIGNVIYRKVLRDNVFSGLCVRESGDKVWLLTKEYPTEILLYNFDWDSNQEVVTEYLKGQEVIGFIGQNKEDYEVRQETTPVGDCQTVVIDGITYSRTYQYYMKRLSGTIIRGIGKVAELNRYPCLLSYREPAVILPGLDYHKVHWIKRNGVEIFRSESAKEWTAGIMDDYRPFVEEDKVWKVGTIPYDLDIPVQIVDYYYFDGDTIIDGKTCKMMMCQHFTSPNYPYFENLSQPNYLRYVGAWYEEDQKVYFYDERTQSMVLKYDFSLEANDTLQFLNVDGYPPFIIGPKQIGGIEGFKGVYRDIMMGQNVRNTTWLEGVGGLDAPFRNAYDPRADRVPEFLMACVVGDEVIYLNDRYEDAATPAGARKNRFDFTHTNKLKPKTRVRSEEEPSLYGEYNGQQLDINLEPLDDAYQVYITNESGKVVYEKAINAGSIVGLNIDISAYAKDHYTVTVENSLESFTGEFETLTNGIEENVKIEKLKNVSIYNLQGQRLNSLQKGLNIVNGRKIYVKN